MTSKTCQFQISYFLTVPPVTLLGDREPPPKIMKEPRGLYAAQRELNPWQCIPRWPSECQVLPQRYVQGSLPLSRDPRTPLIPGYPLVGQYDFKNLMYREGSLVLFWDPWQSRDPRNPLIPGFPLVEQYDLKNSLGMYGIPSKHQQSQEFWATSCYEPWEVWFHGITKAKMNLGLEKFRRKYWSS